MDRIIIPVASVEIEPDAFECSNNFYIVAPAGETVETFAIKVRIPFLRME